MQKVTFLTGSIPPKTGGELYNLKLYSYLDRAGVEVEAIDLYKIRYLLRLARIPLLGPIVVNLCLALLAFGRSDRLLVFDQYFGEYLVALNAIHRYIHRGHVLAIVHHFERYERNSQHSIWTAYFAIVEQLKLSSASHIITNSRYCQQEIMSLGFPQESISILPPGLDKKFRQSVTVEKEFYRQQLSILCVAHCIPRKGIRELVNAASMLGDGHKYVLNIVGETNKDTAYYRSICNIVKREKLGESIIFHGRTDDVTLERLYQQADIFVLPSYKEGFGIVLLEAMYYGLPIVTTNISAIPELVRDGETGLLVSPGNSQELATALATLIEHPGIRKDLGHASRKQLLQNYSWRKTAAKFADIVNDFAV